MKGEKVVAYLKEIDGLGEFKFIFKKNPFKDDNKEKSEYVMESFFNPKDYGLVDFLVGYCINDINAEIEKIEEDMFYFIDAARISCECNLTRDVDGVYTEILTDYFDYDEEDIEELENENKEIFNIIQERYANNNGERLTTEEIIKKRNSK